MKSQEAIVIGEENLNVFQTLEIDKKPVKKTPNLSLNLSKLNDNFPKTVITLQSFHGISYQGIKRVGLRDFLSL